MLIVILLHCLSFPALGREAADTTKAGASDDTPASTLVRRHDESTVVHRMADGESVPGSVCIHRFVNGHSQSGVKFISKELPSIPKLYLTMSENPNLGELQ